MYAVTVGTSAIIGIVAGGVVASVGGAIAVGGTSTVLATEFIKKCNNESSIERAQQAIDDYDTCRNEVVNAWETLKSMCQKISIKVKAFGVEAILQFIWKIYFFIKKQINPEDVINKIALLVANIPIKITGFALLTAAVIGSAGVILNIYELIISAVVIHKKEPHPAAEEIREKVIQINQEIETLEKLKNDLDSECTS